MYTLCVHRGSIREEGHWKILMDLLEGPVTGLMAADETAVCEAVVWVGGWSLKSPVGKG